MSVARFWRENRTRYTLTGNMCPECGRKYFPPREVCPVCHRKSVGRMVEFTFSGRGRIYSHTTVHQVPADFAFQRPYVIALVELEEGPMVTAQIVDVDPEDVHIGMPVEMVFRRIREEGPEGVIQYGYKFRPSSQEIGDGDGR